MELRHLRYFTAVAEHLNFSEASRRIHVAQPSISQTILDLEDELGVRLLFRDRRTVRLTAAGQTFRREALEVLRRNEQAVHLTKRASAGEIGQLRIGFFGSAVAAFLPALVQEYHRRGTNSARTDKLSNSSSEPQFVTQGCVEAKGQERNQNMGFDSLL